jgi:glutathione peroxidase-family protein
MTEKVSVKGKDAHPFYRWAVVERPLEAPRWNFHKYLIGRDGYLKAAFGSAVEPTGPHYRCGDRKGIDCGLRRATESRSVVIFSEKSD